MRLPLLTSLRAAVLSAILLTAAVSAANAGEVRLISAVTMTPVVDGVAEQFERLTGHMLTITFVTGPMVKREIDAGLPFDAVIAPSSVVEDLVNDNKVVAGTRVDVAYAGIGVGVRPGAPKPDVSSVEGFKRALLGARAVAHSADGPSGVYFKGLLDRLGIAEAMRPKLKPLSGEDLATAIPSGEADMLVVTMSVIPTYGGDVAGPVPEELQFYNRFAAAVTTKAKETDAARALVKFLTTPAAVSVIKAKGMEPGAPR